MAAIAAFAPVYVTDVNTVAQALAMTRAVGFALGAEAAAARLAADIEAAFGDLPRLDGLRCAYLIWRRPWMAAGGGSFIDDVLRRLGLANVFAGRPRYPEVTAADLAAAAPDVVLLSSEPYPFKPAHAAGTGGRCCRRRASCRSTARCSAGRAAACCRRRVFS